MFVFIDYIIFILENKNNTHIVNNDKLKQKCLAYSYMWAFCFNMLASALAKTLLLEKLIFCLSAVFWPQSMRSFSGITQRIGNVKSIFGGLCNE